MMMPPVGKSGPYKLHQVFDIDIIQLFIFLDHIDERIDNFGKIVNKHGRRIVEFALKFTF